MHPRLDVTGRTVSRSVLLARAEAAADDLRL
jgi:hypothetical protein